MPKKKTDDKPTSTAGKITATETNKPESTPAIPTGPGDTSSDVRASDDGDSQDAIDTEQVPEASGEATTPEAPGAEVPKLDEVSDPAPERFTAANYEDGATFAPFTTPNGKVFNIRTENARFEAESIDGEDRIASTPTDTIDEFHLFLEEQNPAEKNPFTGQDEAARIKQGVEGADPTVLDEQPVGKAEPTIRVDLDYGAYIGASDWLPKAVNEVEGIIVDNSDHKTVHVLLHNEDGFEGLDTVRKV